MGGRGGKRKKRCWEGSQIEQDCWLQKTFFSPLFLFFCSCLKNFSPKLKEELGARVYKENKIAGNKNMFLSGPGEAEARQRKKKEFFFL